MKYEILVHRIGFASKTIEVEANSQKEAEEKALDEAGNEEFSEKSSEYELDTQPDKFAVLLEKIYHELDSECMDETDAVSMSTVVRILEKYGANPSNME